MMGSSPLVDVQLSDKARPGSPKEYKDLSFKGLKSWVRFMLHNFANPSWSLRTLERAGMVLVLVVVLYAKLIRVLYPLGSEQALDMDSKIAFKAAYTIDSNLWSAPAAEERDPPPFSFDPPLSDWDEQRSAHMEAHPGSNRTKEGRPLLMMLTSSAGDACPDEDGDFLQLQATKNRLDYARIHDHRIFHVLGEMESIPSLYPPYWNKLHVLWTVMVKHPEVEWFWLMDSNVMIADMSFRLPLERFSKYSVVVQGDPNDLFGKRQESAVSSGSLLVRNCQASLDFLAQWAGFGSALSEGPDWTTVFGNHLDMSVRSTTNRRGSGSRLSSSAGGRTTALAWLLVASQEREKWVRQVLVQESILLASSWEVFVERLQGLKFLNHPRLQGTPFAVHFSSCHICDPKWQASFRATCKDGMQRVFYYADNQMMVHYGFAYEDIGTSSLRNIE